MNTIKPKYYINQNKRGINKLPNNSVPHQKPSFKSAAALSNKLAHEVPTIIKELDGVNNLLITRVSNITYASSRMAASNTRAAHPAPKAAAMPVPS